MEGIEDIDKLAVDSGPHHRNPEDERPARLVELVRVEDDVLAHGHAVSDALNATEVKDQHREHNTEIDGK